MHFYSLDYPIPPILNIYYIEIDIIIRKYIVLLKSTPKNLKFTDKYFGMEIIQQAALTSHIQFPLIVATMQYTLFSKYSVT